ncbi:LLM class flavin-dependent oxidoreductase [Cryptosporangium sp. NPDC051539]|uniref:LLM class flavin-dependent oxidoreductase n=1 Tax=Cryptosporangium sp. NPDC051539 TaxID=3363962 RepID=UPI00379EAA40
MQLYSTFPPLAEDTAPDRYANRVIDVSRWAEAAGLRGLLIFTDNESIDPWAAAQLLISHTTALVPLVAVQPAYMHPFTAARMVSSIGLLYGRQVDLNLVAGGYRPHLKALGAFRDHDDRYEWLVEYGQMMAALLRTGGELTHRGAHHDLIDVTLKPPLPAGLEPQVFLAGNSPAAVDAAKQLNVVRLTYPLPPEEYSGENALERTGIRVGIIARETSAEAWRIAYDRYGADELGQAYRDLTATEFDARWHDQVWNHDGRSGGPGRTYWTHPFHTAREFCPYLVGSFAEVGEVLARYIRLGINTLILHCPADEDDLFYSADAVRYSERLVRRKERVG